MAYFDPNHNKPFTALRTAVENGEGSLDKRLRSVMTDLIVLD